MTEKVKVSKVGSNTSHKDSFEETAKRLGCDDDKDAFEKKLGKIAKAKPAKTKRTGGRVGDA